jgi:hypothetical protein
MYGVSGIPHAQFQGTNDVVGGGTNMLPYYLTEYNNFVTVDSPFYIDLSFNVLTRNEIQIDAMVEVTGDVNPADENKLLIMLTYNYADDYSCSVQRYEEHEFSLTSIGETATYQSTFEAATGWDMSKVRAVAMVQKWNGSTGNYPIHQAAIATFPLSTPNPVGNLVFDFNETETFDLTDYFYYQGSPVDAEISVNSDEPSIVEAVLEGNTLTLTSFENSGSALISIFGAYEGYNAVSSFLATVIDANERYLLILDLDPTSTANTVKASIENFYTLPVYVVSDFSTYPLSNADGLFVLLGIYSNNHQLTSAEAAPIVEYLNNGGNVYMEGGDTWNYDTQTALHGMFNIEAPSDGSADLTNVIGQDFLEGFNWSYSGENNYIDRLNPVSPAVSIFNSGVYNCGIAHDAGTYKTVGTSFEVAGLGGTNTLDDAVQGILNFFGLAGEQQFGFIAGTVMDSFGEPIENATVTSGAIMTTTDMLGNYELEVVTGIRTVTAEKEGYASSTIDNVVVEENQTTTVDFVLVGGNPELVPPTNLTAEIIDGNDVMLTWDAPAEPGDLLFYDNGINNDGIGTGGAADFDVAIRFEPSQLAPYNGYLLTTVDFFPREASCDYSIRVWQGVNGATLLVDQPVANPAIGEWNSITLDTPVEIDASQELWFGYRNNTQAGYPAGCDAGPAVSGFGDMIFFQGSWASMNEAYGLNYNWNLQGHVGIPVQNVTIAKPISIGETNIHHTLSVETNFKTGNLENSQNSNSRDFIGYNVYRNWMLLAENVATTEFLDENVPDGTHHYYVTAVYDEGESLPTDYVEVVIEISDSPEDVITFSTKLSGNYPNPFNPSTNIKFATSENGHVPIDIYNVKGQKVTTLVDERMNAGEHSIIWNGKDDSGRNVTSGVYLLSMKTKSYNATQKMILMK